MARPKEFNEEQVLDKAIELFWRQGYEATSIQELVETMEISRGSLYSTFGDKHALFLAALDRYKQNSYRRFRETFDQAASFKEALTSLLSNIIAEAMADTKKRGCLMTNSTVELVSQDLETAERAKFNRECIEDIFQQALIQAQNSGEIAKEADPRALARFLFNTVQGLRVVTKVTAERDVLEDIVKVTLSAFD